MINISINISINHINDHLLSTYEIRYESKTPRL